MSIPASIVRPPLEEMSSVWRIAWSQVLSATNTPTPTHASHASVRISAYRPDRACLGEADRRRRARLVLGRAAEQ